MSLTKSRYRMTANVPINIADTAALDGVTDDTSAWNVALATGRDIYFPEGRSKITGKLSGGGAAAAYICLLCVR